MTTTITERGRMPAETLAGYGDAELAEWFNATADEAWHAQLLAEMARRDAEQAAKPDPRAGQRAEWERMAYAQWLDAERVTRGELLNARGIREHVEPWSLWSGPAHRVELYASEELRNYWLASPRIDITTYRRQAAGEHRAWIDRHDREARNDQLDRDEPGAVRRSTSEGPEGARVRGDGRGDAIPRVAAGGGAQDHASAGSVAGPGRFVRDGGRVSDTTSTTTDRERQRAVNARARALVAAGEPVTGAETPVRVARAGSVPELSGSVVAVRPPGSGLARRERQIDGETVLGYCRAMLAEYAAFPSTPALDAVTLWVAHTHLRDGDGRLSWRATPRLLLMSSQPGSGKSRVLELLARLCPFTYGLDTEPTAAGLAHTLDKEHATVLIDEADVLFGAGKRKESVRAVINSGYTAKGTVLRMRGSKADRARVFGPMAIAGLDVLEKATGTALDATLDRCVIVRMSRAGRQLPDVAARADKAGELLNGALAAWAQQNMADMADAEPEMPEGVHGRMAQIWQPLLAIADAAGGEWPARAREACEELAVRGGISDEMQMDAMDELAAMFGEPDDEWLPGEDDLS